jgi:hypothetical protein
MNDLKRALRIAGLKAEALALEAETLTLPEDVPGWLDEAAKRALSLSDAFPHKPVILAHIDIARACLRRGDEAGLRRFLVKVCRNLSAAGHDQWVLGVQEQFGKAAAVRAEKLRAERESVWGQWRTEAERIQRDARRPYSKRNLARKVKESLGLPDSTETVRKRI